MKRYLFCLSGALMCLVVLVREGPAQEVTLEQQNGVTYRVVRRREQLPVASTQWQEHTQTVYSERYVTELRDCYRKVYSPVTEYRCEPRWHNWWNPLGRPYVAFHMKPVTRWETRLEKYQAPVTYREVVPEQRIVRVPARTLGFEERERVVSRVPLDTPRMAATRNGTAGTAARPIGGVSVLDGDPPRAGMRGTTLR